MATTAQTIIDRTNHILQDRDNVRWSQAELLGWMNEGQLQIIDLQPSAYSKIRELQLVTGTRQTLPVDAIRLLDVIRNQDGIYNTSVREVARIDLDTQVPNWHEHKPHRIVQHYMYDRQQLDVFYVYPPQPEDSGSLGPGIVETLLAVIPPVLATVNDEIAIKDIYAPPLVNYVLYRAYAKDSEASANIELKDMYFQQFMASLGAQQTANEGGEVQ